MRASEETMAKIHELLAEDMLRRVRDGETVVTKDGEAIQVPPSAATLNVIRQFLKDNHIEGIPQKENALGQLIDSLPFDEDDEDTNVVRLGR